MEEFLHLAEFSINLPLHLDATSNAEAKVIVRSALPVTTHSALPVPSQSRLVKRERREEHYIVPASKSESAWLTRCPLNLNQRTLVLMRM